MKQAKSKGRGLFTAKAMKAGDLQLCEKAFCYSVPGKFDHIDKEIAFLPNAGPGVKPREYRLDF